jgi:FKBP-type peptidyl-prolyl cis-trans isomerase FkpA
MRRSRRRLARSSVALVVTLAACGGSGAAVGATAGQQTAAAPAQTIATATFATDLDVDVAKFTRTTSGLYILDVIKGTGVVASEGRKATFRYSAALPDGRIVESQRAPIEVELNADVMRGLREGIIGMRAGGQRRLIIPPSLGYGRVQYKNVPPSSILVFDVELISMR